MNNNKFIILPCQIIEKKDCIIIQRGTERLMIQNTNVLVIIRVIQKALLERPKTIVALLSLFAEPIKPIVQNFIQTLIRKRFIIDESNDIKDLKPNLSQETPQDVFYWHFNQFQSSIAKILNTKTWAFIGVNLLNKYIIKALQRDQLKNFVVIDDTCLRNIKFFNDQHQITDDFWLQPSIKIMNEANFLKNNLADIGFIVAASEFGSFFLLEKWNEFAVNNNIPFYSLILQDMIGYAGPLVIPKECACFACLKARQNSTVTNFEEKRLTEPYAFEGQTTVAYHLSMVKVLAEIGVFELIKFKANIFWEIGTFSEINLLNNSMWRRKLLKAPRCLVCSEFNKNPAVNINKQLTSKDSWEEVIQ